MKKIYKIVVPALLILTVFQSCATVFGGSVNTYQRTRPLAGQPSRPLRPVALIADILFFWPGAIIDFATCAIYKPVPPESTSAPISAPSN